MPRKTIFTIGLIVLGLALALLAAMLILPSMMRPASTSPDQVQQIAPDGRVSVVGQVVEVDGNTLTVEVLEGNGYDVFDRRTGLFLQAEQTPEMKIVMGEAADVQVGAIAQFDGTKVGADGIRLSRIVILTGYVEGPPPP